MKYYEVSDDNTDKDAVLDIVGDVTADAVSRNIIYSYDPATKLLTPLLLKFLILSQVIWILLRYLQNHRLP